MQYLAAIVPAAPMRAEASHRSEIVSELLFGEKAVELDKKGDFTKVKCIYDHYEGWVQTRQLTQVNKHFITREAIHYTDKPNALAFLNDTPLHLSLATPVYRLRKIGPYKVRYNKIKPLVNDYSEFSPENIRAIALQYMNTSYLWGGRSSFGIDCSGFVQQIFRFFGKKLPRDASRQVREGEIVGFLQSARCGDLAFFDNEEGNITHVGILLDSSTIIHSSARVHIDPIDSEGIINRELAVRTHHLRIIKRI